MKLYIAALILVCSLACTPLEYGKALDQCAFEHAGDRPATVACQCDVAQQFGRSCDFLHAVPDGGAADAQPKDAVNE